MNTYIHKLLFDISESLATDDLAALKFLSLEHIPLKKQEAIQDPKAFFQALQEKALISNSDQAFLKELLYRISRVDILVSHLGSSREEMERELQIPGRAKVSPYRQLLYQIAEDLTPEDVNSVKFLLQKQIPKGKLQDNASMLMVLLEMERNGVITQDDVTILKDILKGFRADLKKKIDIYELKTKVEMLVNGLPGKSACIQTQITSILLPAKGQGRAGVRFDTVGTQGNVSEENTFSPTCTSLNPAEQGAVGGPQARRFVEAYKMENNPHGYCVILNNYIFKNTSLNREGTAKDGETVKEVFKRLQFETVEYMDLEANQLYAKVKEYSKKDHSNMDCFVCFILSHGEKDKIKGIDEECINIKDMLLCFSGSNCPSLAGKPKLFFIQACQGSVGHPAVILEEDLSVYLETDAIPLPSIPDRADILLGLSTVEDFESYRSVKTGSVYIQCLCEKLQHLCPLPETFPGAQRGAMEFSRRLFVISESLATDDLAALKFLSLEHIPLRKQEAIQDPKAFFQALQEKALISDSDQAFLKELFYRINRVDILVSHLGSSQEEMERELRIPGRAKVSPYRHLLFQLSENITTEELKCFKFLLGKELPKSKLNTENTMIDIFTEMEKKRILGEDNLEVLKSLCEKVDKSLVKRIEEYELSLCGEEEMLCTEGQSSSVILGVTAGNGSKILEVYKMTSRPRGVCLILNNHNFERTGTEVAGHKLKNRKGTDVDAAALRKVFSKLHFKIAEYKDLTAKEIHNIVKRYQHEDHKDKDCFVCCILSHGKKGIIYGVDGQEVPIQELTTSFSGQNCHSLAGKPKVFFVQACQGDARQQGVVIEMDSTEQDSSVETDGRLQLDFIPSEADFLLGMATLQDHVSYRSPTQGSWYIQSLCQHLENSCPRGEDILTILTAVNQEVSEKLDKQNAGKQMPQPSFTLRKKLIFPVN
ncbi:uncharacterized protein ACNFOS_004055 [Eudromia elegans]